MLGPNYLDLIRYFYCTCLTRPPDFLSRFRNLAGATQRIKIDKAESQVAPVEEADLAEFEQTNSQLKVPLVFGRLPHSG